MKSYRSSRIFSIRSLTKDRFVPRDDGSPVFPSLRAAAKQSNLLLITFCFSFLFSFSQETKKAKKFYTAVLAGPVISFYKIPPHLGASVRPATSVYFSVQEQARIRQDFYIVGGLEYSYHSFNFNSYYFAPDTQRFYVKDRYDYNYQLSFQEARLNLLLRYTAGTELRKPLTPYLEAGYVARYLFDEQMNVLSNLSGQTLFNQGVPPVFEHHFFSNNLSGGLKFNVGIQHNFLRTHRAWFVQLGYLQGLSRILVNQSFTPAGLAFGNSFFMMGAGFKF